jgi:hypothetical protein
MYRYVAFFAITELLDHIAQTFGLLDLSGISGMRELTAPNLIRLKMQSLTGGASFLDGVFLIFMAR